MLILRSVAMAHASAPAPRSPTRAIAAKSTTTHQPLRSPRPTAIAVAPPPAAATRIETIPASAAVRRDARLEARSRTRGSSTNRRETTNSARRVPRTASPNAASGAAKFSTKSSHQPPTCSGPDSSDAGGASADTRFHVGAHVPASAALAPPTAVSVARASVSSPRASWRFASAHAAVAVSASTGSDSVASCVATDMSQVARQRSGSHRAFSAVTPAFAKASIARRPSASRRAVVASTHAGSRRLYVSPAARAPAARQTSSHPGPPVSASGPATPAAARTLTASSAASRLGSSNVAAATEHAVRTALASGWSAVAACQTATPPTATAAAAATASRRSTFARCGLSVPMSPPGLRSSWRGGGPASRDARGGGRSVCPTGSSGRTVAPSTGDGPHPSDRHIALPMYEYFTKTSGAMPASSSTPCTAVSM